MAFNEYGEIVREQVLERVHAVPSAPTTRNSSFFGYQWLFMLINPVIYPVAYLWFQFSKGGLEMPTIWPLTEIAWGEWFSILGDRLGMVIGVAVLTLLYILFYAGEDLHLWNIIKLVFAPVIILFYLVCLGIYILPYIFGIWIAIGIIQLIWNILTS